MKPEKNIDNFLKQFYVEDETSVILKVHLYIEQKVDELIGVIFPRPNYVLTQTFAQKVNILNSMDVLGEKKFESLIVINKIRNKFSHKLGYKLTKQDVQELRKICKTNEANIPKELLTLNLPNNIFLLTRVAANFEGSLGYQIEISKPLSPLSTISIKKFSEEHKKSKSSK